MTIFGIKIGAYMICAASGGAAAVLLFLFNFYFFNKKYKHTAKRALLLFALIGACAGGGVALSFLAHFFFVKNFWEYNIFHAFEVTGPQYFTTLTFFLTLFYFALKFFKFETVPYFYIVLPSLVLFSAVSRLCCMFGGCCGGVTIKGFTVPTREFELIFALSALFIICYYQYKNKDVNLFETDGAKFNYALRYYYIYAVYRLLTDFLRDKEHVVLVFNIFDVAQFIALIAIIYLTFNAREALIGPRKN